MLISSKKLLEEAKENNKVIFQFDTNNLEFTKYILEEANLKKKPIILGFSEDSIKYMGGYQTVVNIVNNLVEELNIKVDIVLHLDHGRTTKCCEAAIKAGFTSIMYDGSKLPLDSNIKNTKYLKNKYPDISIEGELGAIGTSSNKISYTNIENAIKYVKMTNIDALAISVGNVHGKYKGKPKIDTDLIKEISNKVDIPLVLHGGSGIKKDTLEEIINNGISKININTQIQVVWAKKVKKYLLKHNKEYDYKKIISSGEKEIKKLIDYYLNIA